MTPEQMLAMKLGEDLEKQKLAAHMKSLSVEELGSLLGGTPAEEPSEEIETLSAQEKVAMADAWGRELARADFEKKALNMTGVGQAVGRFAGQAANVLNKGVQAAKPMAQKAVSAASPHLQKATTALQNTGMGKSMAIGAGANAALGAAKGLVAPGHDQNGQQRGRFGAMMGGAARGAASGAVMGAAAKGLAHHGMPQTLNWAQGH